MEKQKGHTVAEWEAGKPSNVEFLMVRIKDGMVASADAYAVFTQHLPHGQTREANKKVRYNAEGHAYVHGCNRKREWDIKFNH